MVFSNFCQKSLNLCLFLCVAFLFGTSTVSAQTVGPGCDPVFMKAIQDKAWMEAQREIMIAQTTIAKPDSVFALGCFDNFANGYSINFHNNNKYDFNGPIGSYLGSAFNHYYGGGHASSLGGEPQKTNDGCGLMASLWNAARGANLENNTPLLATLKDISTFRRGEFPIDYDPPSGFTDRLKKFYDPKAQNKSLGDATTGTDFDDMKLFAEVTAPQSQLNPATCAKGIPTGISIDVSGGARPEIVCPNPGCISDGAATPKCCDYAGTNCSP